MSDLGRVLVLLSQARDRFVPFDAEVRERYDGPTARRAEERFAVTPAGQADGGQRRVEERAALSGYIGFEATTRLWVAASERMRSRTETPGREHVERVRGLSESWWIDDWIDPGRLLGSLALEPVGERTVAGRRTLVIGARPRPDAGPGDQFTLFQLGHGADEFELDVDAEVGMLLRTAALLDGREFLVREAVELDRWAKSDS